MSVEEALDHLSSLDVETQDDGPVFAKASGYGLEGNSVGTASRPSIQQMVTNLRESMKEVQARVGEAFTEDMMDEVIDLQPSSGQLVMQDTVSTPVLEVMPPDAFQSDENARILGSALHSAVSRANGANRFDVVRDSVTGEPTDVLMHPRDRPLADSKNIFTVRTSADLYMCHLFAIALQPAALEACNKSPWKANNVHAGDKFWNLVWER